MKMINGFSGCWLTEPIDILDSENGTVQMRLRTPITESQQQATIHYLIAEGFVSQNSPPGDDYRLKDDFGNLEDLDDDEDIDQLI